MSDAFRSPILGNKMRVLKPAIQYRLTPDGLEEPIPTQDRSVLQSGHTAYSWTNPSAHPSANPSVNPPTYPSANVPANCPFADKSTAESIESERLSSTPDPPPFSAPHLLAPSLPSPPRRWRTMSDNLAGSPDSKTSGGTSESSGIFSFASPISTR